MRNFANKNNQGTCLKLKEKINTSCPPYLSIGAKYY